MSDWRLSAAELEQRPANEIVRKLRSERRRNRLTLKQLDRLEAVFTNFTVGGLLETPLSELMEIQGLGVGSLRKVLAAVYWLYEKYGRTARLAEAKVFSGMEMRTGMTVREVNLALEIATSRIMRGWYKRTSL